MANDKIKTNEQLNARSFSAQRGGLGKELLAQIARVKNRLRAAFAVADINEDEAAKVATGMDPAAQGDSLPDV